MIADTSFLIDIMKSHKDAIKKAEELLHSDYFTVSWLSGKMMEKVSSFMVEHFHYLFHTLEAQNQVQQLTANLLWGLLTHR